MGFVNKSEEINVKLAEALTQMAAAQQADHKFVNSTTEAKKKTLETMMQMMLEQQKQMTSVMEKVKMAQGTGNGGSRQALTKADKCPRCKKKAHKGGKAECWEDPKNADKRPKWYIAMLEKKAAKKKET